MVHRGIHKRRKGDRERRERKERQTERKGVLREILREERRVKGYNMREKRKGRNMEGKWEKNVHNHNLCLHQSFFFKLSNKQKIDAFSTDISHPFSIYHIYFNPQELNPIPQDPTSNFSCNHFPYPIDGLIP